MAERTEQVVRPELRSPRSAAIAGILFALLFGTSWVLIRLSIPADALEASDWLESQAKNLSLAMSLIPFSGISFLWFMGVVRERMGHHEDQFFSTLFSGAGYLYLGMTFANRQSPDPKSVPIEGAVEGFYRALRKIRRL